MRHVRIFIILSSVELLSCTRTLLYFIKFYITYIVYIQSIAKVYRNGKITRRASILEKNVKYKGFMIFP